MQTFHLDLQSKGIVPLLYAKQRDVGTKICVVLTTNGIRYPVPENTQFSVWFSGKSGDGNYTEIDGRSAFFIDDNEVTVELIYQMLNKPGEHVMCLVMNDAEGNQKGLWNIPYFVEPIPGADSKAATDYYNAFLESQKRAEEAAERAEEVADSVGSPVSYKPQTIPEKNKVQAKENIGASTFYHTKREPLVIDGTTDSDKKADADYIWGLYNDLMEDYSDEVKKLVWIDETASWSYEWEDYKPADGTFINYVYEISTREYPTDGLYANAYEADPQIKKPKYLILSGIHGDERKTCLSTYKFVRDVLRGHNVPQSFREGVTLCVMPVGTPSAINAFNRPNENAVDINRNFDWHWVSATKTDELYGTFTYGTTAASEKETQAITNWLASHTDAALFIDYHNSGQINEQVVIMGLADTQKKIAMRGIDRIIPYWKDVIGYPKTMKLSSGEKKVIFSYTATAEIAGAHCYAQEVLGINSLAMETAVFYPNGDLTHADFLANRHLCPPETIAMGAEALGNILIEFYNHADMASQAGTPIYNGEAVLNINTKTHARYNGEVE